MAERAVFGWDIGGAHVKVAHLVAARVVDAVQWPCALWRGTDELARVFDAAHERWSGLGDAAHVVTMTGELVDHFAHREDGVARIAALAADALPHPRFFAGDGDADVTVGWCDAPGTRAAWSAIASANWLATARHAAHALPDAHGLLIDIGSTTTDLIPFRAGRVLTGSRRDADRLALGELVYHGVVRTPLAALGPRIAWRGVAHNVMNEFFATSADVYRLTGELDPAHDQHPAADNGTKDVPGSRARLARMIGLDARDGSDAEWGEFARAWRAAQLAELRGQVERVAHAHGLGAGALAVAAGSGAFLVPEIVPPGWLVRSYAVDVARAEPAHAREVDLVAPAVAVAVLWCDAQQSSSMDGPPELQRCGS